MKTITKKIVSWNVSKSGLITNSESIPPPPNEAPKRPTLLQSETHKIKIDFGDGKPRNAYVTVSFFSGTKKPYEILVQASYQGLDGKDLQILELTTRSASMNLRHNVPLQFICEQLDKIGGQYIYSIPTNIARILRTYIPGQNQEENEEPPEIEVKPKSEILMMKCPKCEKRAYVPTGQTCGICTECGFSGCG